MITMVNGGDVNVNFEVSEREPNKHSRTLEDNQTVPLSLA